MDDQIESKKPIEHAALLVIPTRNVVVFPGAVTYISVGRQMSVTAAELAGSENRPVAVMLQRDATVDEPTGDDLYDVGTTVTVQRTVTASNGT